MVHTLYTATEEGGEKEHTPPWGTRHPHGLERGCGPCPPLDPVVTSGTLAAMEGSGQPQQHLALPWARRAPVRRPDPGPCVQRRREAWGLQSQGQGKEQVGGMSQGVE